MFSPITEFVSLEYADYEFELPKPDEMKWKLF